MITCSFTGHRDIPERDIPVLEGLLERAVEYFYKNGVRRFCLGGAVGFDTLAAKTVLRLKLKCPDVSLILILPCQDQDGSWDERDRDMYSYILTCADEIEYVSDEYTKGCMKKRNQRLVELCDVLVAYSYKERSGSAQTVRMANEAGKTVYNLYGKR